MNKSNIKNIDLDERVCFNCKYRVWLVGLGLGVRCGYFDTIKENQDIRPSLPVIPHLRHTCDNFQFRKPLNEQRGL